MFNKIEYKLLIENYMTKDEYRQLIDKYMDKYMNIICQCNTINYTTTN